jgi:hypothetical protein
MMILCQPSLLLCLERRALSAFQPPYTKHLKMQQSFEKIITVLWPAKGPHLELFYTPATQEQNPLD